MEVWIQKHDYASINLDCKNTKEIIAEFLNFSWEDELSSFAEDNELKNCPPGMGINANGNLLHLCPNDKENLFLNYHHSSTVKVLGLFPKEKKEIHSASNFPVSQAQELIKMHMEDKKSEILEI